MRAKWLGARIMARFILLPLAVFALFSFFTGKAAADCDVICTDGETCIAAGLYPYVPDTDAFADAICNAWTSAGHTEKLYLIADESVWDGGYGSDPAYINGSGTQVPIDVFVYDAMYLNYWEPLTTPIPASQISDPSDFVSYALNALAQPSGDMLALPMLGCTNIMFYINGDTPMDGVATLPDFLSVNPAGVYISPVPFGRSGAMINMAGKTTIGVNYMVKGYLDSGSWPSMTSLDPTIIASMADLSETASYYNALTGAIPPLPDVEDQYIRAGYFSQGYGRTSIGFFESMSQMSDTTRSRLTLRAFPWSNRTGVANMFYADVVGVNSNSSYLSGGGTLPFALANLMTEAAVVQAAIAPLPNELSYLFPARESVLGNLAGMDALYAQMQTILNGTTSELVAMPTTDRTSFHSFGGQVQQAVMSGFSGHCDLESPTFIGSDTQAATVCPSVCSTSGGWVGSWTNVAPPAWPGYSACGCNQCTQSSPLGSTVAPAAISTPVAQRN